MVARSTAARFVAVLATAVSFSASCTGGEPTHAMAGPMDTSAPAAPVMSVSLPAPAPAPVARRAVSLASTARHTVAYADVAGRQREVRIEIRPASTGSDPRPVVVWSHGGSSGRSDPRSVGNRWGEAFTSAGYTFVAIAHPARSAQERTLVCAAVGVAECAAFNPLWWDRPHDVDAVLDRLEAIGDDRLDLQRLIYGGHSAGAFSVLVTAGMSWPHDTDLAPSADPRPAGFLAASPPGSEVHGLGAWSFDGLDRPVLFLSGDGDTTSGTTAEDRRQALGLVPPAADAVAVWVGHDAARHGAFDLSTDPCRRAGAAPHRCDELVRTLATTGLAFAADVTGTEGFDRAGLVAALEEQLPSGFSVVLPVGDRPVRCPGDITGLRPITWG